MYFSKSLLRSKITFLNYFSNNYVPCFNRIDFVVIPSYVELPWDYISTQVIQTIFFRYFGF